MHTSPDHIIEQVIRLQTLLKHCTTPARGFKCRLWHWSRLAPERHERWHKNEPAIKLISGRQSQLSQNCTMKLPRALHVLTLPTIAQGKGKVSTHSFGETSQMTMTLNSLKRRQPGSMRSSKPRANGKELKRSSTYRKSLRPVVVSQCRTQLLPDFRSRPCINQPQSAKISTRRYHVVSLSPPSRNPAEHLSLVKY